jgi:hypothetical protein
LSRLEVNANDEWFTEDNGEKTKTGEPHIIEKITIESKTITGKSVFI